MNYYLPLVLRHVFTKVSLMCLTGKSSWPSLLLPGVPTSPRSCWS